MPVDVAGTYDIPILRISSYAQRMVCGGACIRDFFHTKESFPKSGYCLLSSVDISTGLPLVDRRQALLVEVVTILVMFLGYFLLCTFGLLPLCKRRAVSKEQKMK